MRAIQHTFARTMSSAAAASAAPCAAAMSTAGGFPMSVVNAGGEAAGCAGRDSAISCVAASRVSSCASSRRAAAGGCTAASAAAAPAAWCRTAALGDGTCTSNTHVGSVPQRYTQRYAACVARDFSPVCLTHAMPRTCVLHSLLPPVRALRVLSGQMRLVFCKRSTAGCRCPSTLKTVCETVWQRWVHMLCQSARVHKKGTQKTGRSGGCLHAPGTSRPPPAACRPPPPPLLLARPSGCSALQRGCGHASE